MKIMRLITTLILALFVTGIVGESFANTIPPTPVGRVVWIKGNSFKAIMQNKEERLLQKDSVIYLHDLLITDATTIAEVVFTDNTLITFKPETKFSIDQYTYQLQKKNRSVGKSFMRLLEGGFRTITGLIAKNNPPDYAVQTPIATIGVRGTDYSIYIHDGQLFLAFYGGTPCVTSLNKSQVCLDKDHPYAKVQNANSSPEFLNQQPEGFRNQLEITKVQIGLFQTIGGNGQYGGRNGGPITSFCIQ